jgi:K+-sensing histidine kinase KdpD
MDNAIKYSISLPAKLSIRSGILNGELQVDVIHENSSPHADSKLLGKLFYRGSHSQGAGVGLYLIKTLMNKMSGDAKFQSIGDGQKGEFIAELRFKLDGEAKHVD